MLSIRDAKLYYIFFLDNLVCQGIGVRNKVYRIVRASFFQCFAYFYGDIVADFEIENNEKDQFDLIVDGDGTDDFDSDGFWWEAKPPREQAVAYYTAST